MKYIADRHLRAAALIAAGAVMQLPPLFCGFELCDSGFYMTFYDNIYSHPESVGYNFMYYLSGVTGGAVASATGGSILAMRVFGAICNLLCICCMWAMTGTSRRFTPLLLTVLLVTAGAWGTPQTFYNDIMTVLLALLSLTLLVRALTRHNSCDTDTEATERHIRLLLLLSGAAAGLNTLTRLPNVLEILFAVMIPATAYIRSRRMTLQWLSGWTSGLAAGLLAAAACGHLPLLAATVRDLCDTAATPGSESTHGLSSLIAAQISSWLTIGRLTVKLAALAAIYRITTLVCRRHAGGRPRTSRAVKLTAALTLYAAAAFLMLRADIMTALTAAALLGSLMALGRQNLRLQAIASLMMIFILPLGSDNGIYNAGTIMLWGALATAMLMSWQTQSHAGTTAIALLLLGSCAAGLWRGATYFDNTPLPRMTGRIEAPAAHGIRTAPERATRINDMLDTLRRHTRPGDTLLVYGSAPMLNHLTGTVPAIGCSWPELLSAAQTERRLEAASTPPRFVMMLRFRTLGAELGEPSEEFMRGADTPQGHFHTPAKSAVMLRYVEKKGYRLLSETPDFALYRYDSTPAR